VIQNRKKPNPFIWVLTLSLLAFLWFALFGFLRTDIEAHEIRGSASLQARLFPNPPIHSGQEDHSFSFAAAPEYIHRFADNSVFTFLPFVRLDSADSERTHFDIRDLSYTWSKDAWEIRFGVRREFWGVVESVNLVNVINQIDLVENPEQKDKLGQPMFNVSYSHEWGTFDFFMLPYFRERTFTGEGGRLRFGLVIDTDNPIYESAAEEHHIDFAFRYFHSIQELDVGISYFMGTSRDAIPILGFSGGQLTLRPLYQQIRQTGLDLLWVTGSWIWKFEGIYRYASITRDYYAAVGGLEYIFDGFLETGMDLGIFLEYIYDERDGAEFTVNEDDVLVGLRFVFNDIRTTSIQASATFDLDTNTWFALVKASTRLDSHWRLSLRYIGLVDQPPEDIFFDLRDDDFFEVELTYFF
jgi:hypothetical protein